MLPPRPSIGPGAEVLLVLHLLQAVSGFGIAAPSGRGNPFSGFRLLLRLPSGQPLLRGGPPRHPPLEFSCPCGVVAPPPFLFRAFSYLDPTTASERGIQRQATYHSGAQAAFGRAPPLAPRTLSLQSYLSTLEKWELAVVLEVCIRISRKSIQFSFELASWFPFFYLVQIRPFQR